MAASVTTLTVTGMTCGHCAARVDKALRKVPGVTDVKVDVAGPAKVEHGVAVDPAALVVAVEKAGYAAIVS